MKTVQFHYEHFFLFRILFFFSSHFSFCEVIFHRIFLCAFICRRIHYHLDIQIPERLSSKTLFSFSQWVTLSEQLSFLGKYFFLHQRTKKKLSKNNGETSNWKQRYSITVFIFLLINSLQIMLGNAKKIVCKVGVFLVIFFRLLFRSLPKKSFKFIHI